MILFFKKFNTEQCLSESTVLCIETRITNSILITYIILLLVVLVCIHACAVKNMSCRGCNKVPETQQHILETCAKDWKMTKNITITSKELFSTSLPILRNAARKLLVVNKEIEMLWIANQKRKTAKPIKRKATDQPELRKKKKRKIERREVIIDKTLAEVIALVRANRANYFARLGL